MTYNFYAAYRAEKGKIHMKKTIFGFKGTDIIIYLLSVSAIIASFIIFRGSSYLNLIASLVGVTSLIFNAKGDPIGQLLMVIFSLMYGVISFGSSYYGEMATYLLMTMPMAITSLISWIKHPFEKGKSQVKINRIRGLEYVLLIPLTFVVTVAFGILLAYLDTPDLALSTVSVATSFVAAYLTFRRSHYFALAYAANDVVLIALWLNASMRNASYYSVVICFAAFLVNDLYGFICWCKMKRDQRVG